MGSSENDRTKNREIDMGSGIKKYSFKEILEWGGSFGNLLNKSEYKQYCYDNGLIPFSFLKKREELDDWLEDYGDYLSRKGVTYEEIKGKKKDIKSIFDTWFEFKVPSLTIENRPFYEVAEVAKALTYFPYPSPFITMIRLPLVEISCYEVALSIALLIISIGINL